MNQAVLTIFASFFGSLGYALLYNTRGRRIFIPAVGGAVFWGVYLLFLRYNENEYLGFFIVAILVTIYSEIWARILKTPATTVLMPAVIPFIPGGALYYAMSAALQMDMITFAQKARAALGLAAALAAGIMLVTSLRGPVFFIIHMARTGGHKKRDMEK